LGRNPHPLGNIIQFHDLLSDPKDLSLLDASRPMLAR
jgi:hypothetical protein